LNTVFEKSKTVSRRRESQNLPFRISELLLFLKEFPSGLASTQLSVALRGIAGVSPRSQEISGARLEATRKLIQRTRHLLVETNSQWRLEYCRKKRVWKVIKFPSDPNRQISNELN
jgi:hypothetical protein